MRSIETLSVEGISIKGHTVYDSMNMKCPNRHLHRTEKPSSCQCWRNEKVSLGSDENVLDSEGCPALKIVRILSCVPQKSRFYISELFSIIYILSHFRFIWLQFNLTLTDWFLGQVPCLFPYL